MLPDTAVLGLVLLAIVVLVAEPVLNAVVAVVTFPSRHRAFQDGLAAEKLAKHEKSQRSIRRQQMLLDNRGEGVVAIEQLVDPDGIDNPQWSVEEWGEEKLKTSGVPIEPRWY